jgi:hypothetical protein
MGINLDCYACLRDRHRPLAFRYGGIDAEVRRLSYAAWILWHLGYLSLELPDAFAWLTDRSGSRPTVRIQLPPPPSLGCCDSPTKSIKLARLRALRAGGVDRRKAHRWLSKRMPRILSIARLGGGLPRSQRSAEIRRTMNLEPEVPKESSRYFPSGEAIRLDLRSRAAVLVLANLAGDRRDQSTETEQ